LVVGVWGEWGLVGVAVWVAVGLLVWGFCVGVLVLKSSGLASATVDDSRSPLGG